MNFFSKYFFSIILVRFGSLGNVYYPVFYGYCKMSFSFSGRLSRKRKKLKETFEESCGEESHCLFALIHVCHLEDTQCTSSGLVASTSEISPNLDSSTGMLSQCVVRRFYHVLKENLVNTGWMIPYRVGFGCCNSIGAILTTLRPGIFY